MIGNDVVDVKLAAQATNIWRPRLQHKIFTEEERAFLNNSNQPEKQFWVFWTMKEAAYKAHQRKLNHPRRFNPHRLQCTINELKASVATGSVTIDNHIYFTSTVSSSSFIHSIARAQPSAAKNFKLLASTEPLNAELFKYVAQQLKLNIADIKINKDKNHIPSLYCGRQKLKLPFSTSHHGKFAAFVTAVK